MSKAEHAKSAFNNRSLGGGGQMARLIFGGYNTPAECGMSTFVKSLSLAAPSVLSPLLRDCVASGAVQHGRLKSPLAIPYTTQQ
jgi:hypothetical protein